MLKEKFFETIPKRLCLHSVHPPPPPPPFAGRIEPPTKFSKRGLDRTSIFGGGDLFQWEGGCNFYIENKLKSEIFNDKNEM